MNQNLRRLAKIEAALALLQQKRKVCLFLNISRDWTPKQIQAAADDLIDRCVKAGKLDLQQHEPLIARFLTAAEDESLSDKV
jgi:hypothetical protein